MTIETNHANQGTRHAKHADSRSTSKGQPTGADASFGSDFMAILSGLGEDAGEGTIGLTPSDILTPDGRPSADCIDAGAIAVDGALAQIPTFPGAVLAQSSLETLQLAPGTESTRTQRLSEVGAGELSTQQGSLAKLSAPNDAAPVLPLPAVKGEQAAVESAPALQASPLKVLSERVGSGFGYTDAPGLSQPSSTELANGPVDLMNVVGTEKALASTKPMKPLATTVSAVYDGDAITVGRDTQSADVADARVFTRFGGVSEPSVLAPASGMAIGLEANSLLRDGSRLRSSEKRGSTEPLASFSPPTPFAVIVDTAATPVSTEYLVAEKVAYWVTHDVHNAELKLDGLSDQSIEVSIRLQGNEAHVAFRTDELQTRSALEQAGATLRELLQKEGLNLAGVSVGTAGAGDGQRNPSRDDRPFTRKGSVQMVAGPSTSHARPHGMVVGQSLDLFV